MLNDYFRAQAEWRRHRAEEYPDDARNARSAEALESLAEYVESGEIDRLVEKGLTPHLFEEISLGGEETHRAVARYGFDYPVTGADPTQHVEFLERLQVLCMVDAYEFVRDRRSDDDPTGTLYGFELDAAREGVYLWEDYFERRSGSTEHELEGVVEGHRLGAE